MRDFSLDLDKYYKSLIRPLDGMFDEEGNPLIASLPFSDISSLHPIEEMEATWTEEELLLIQYYEEKYGRLNGAPTSVVVDS